MTQNGSKVRYSGPARPRSKAQEKRARLQTGALGKAMDRAKNCFSGNPRAQLTAILEDALIRAATGRNRLVSDHRQGAFNRVFQQFITELQEERVYLKHLDDFSQKHALALLRRWERNGIKESTIQNRVSVMRRVMTLVGKPHIVPKGRLWKELLQRNGITAGTVGRRYVLDLPKGWADMGIDIEQKIGPIRLYDERAGGILDLMHAFGLRDEEGVMMQPALSDKGTYIHVHRGSKGGKSREVPFSRNPEKAAWQREVLERAKRIAAQDEKGEMGWPGRSLEQAMDHFGYICSRFGLTKEKSGIVPYGLRHQFATELFREISGLPAPVLDILPWSEYESQWDKVSAAFLEVSRALGHERGSVSAAYTGSVASLKSRDLKTNAWVKELAGAADAFKHAGVHEAWLVGEHANGFAPRGAVMTVAVRFRDVLLNLQQVGAAIMALQRALSQVMRAPLKVVPVFDPGMPDGGAEIVF